MWASAAHCGITLAIVPLCVYIRNTPVPCLAGLRSFAQKNRTVGKTRFFVCPKTNNTSLRYSQATTSSYTSNNRNKVSRRREQPVNRPLDVAIRSLERCRRGFPREAHRHDLRDGGLVHGRRRWRGPSGRAPRLLLRGRGTPPRLPPQSQLALDVRADLWR